MIAPSIMSRYLRSADKSSLVERNCLHASALKVPGEMDEIALGNSIHLSTFTK